MSFFGISARNQGQKRLAEACKSSTSPIIIGTGRAGTGKSLIAQSVGFDTVFEERRWGTSGQFVYTRLQVDVGKPLGFLPGGIDEKSAPYLRPFYDNLRLMDNGDYMKNYITSGKIVLDQIQTVRGGTYHESYLIVDEAQNLDNATMTAIGTRLALGSKLILLGNFAQIDVPSLKKPENNGFFKLLKGLYDSGRHDMFTHVHLTKGERGPIADLVESIMVPEEEINPSFLELEERGLEIIY
jgi:predicted ribonuclease YlaK